MTAAPSAGVPYLMNDLEVTMTPKLRDAQPDLQAHTVAVEAAAVVLGLARSVPAQLRFLADQLCRAACSAALNLAEGRGRSGRDRLHHYRIAYGSAKEAGSALQMLLAGGLVDAQQVAKACELLDRVRAMTWRLMRPRR